MKGLPLLLLLLLTTVDAQTSTDVASFVEAALGKCGSPETGAYNPACLQGEIAKNPFDLDPQELGIAIASCGGGSSFEDVASCAQGQLIASAVTDALGECGNPETGVYNLICLQGELAKQPIIIDQEELNNLMSACAVNKYFGDCAQKHILHSGTKTDDSNGAVDDANEDTANGAGDSDGSDSGSMANGDNNTTDATGDIAGGANDNQNTTDSGSVVSPPLLDPNGDETTNSSTRPSVATLLALLGLALSHAFLHVSE
mmetsp:Transcript_10592/g.29788  ORF Transcript_10592/g.29788 Transcript_10592/m.29788 type:complete len:258 (-) Transcript_10592:933-1706(-)|eukprot:CAMPEP_0181027314 /NCGR_PEP_ID=MMETSP1070-20121207/4099_1 /TAXON_ID=265543 /ORGANISM="Minutocellus polymorphus, Strain NH13" /LENGTH=257 /DNA_ID=CAMNT_0023104549 /DNA_START=101 /DNA_END=874 /DNA_ORIENTATION=-